MGKLILVTVAEIFRKTNLSLCGPVRWKAPVTGSSAGAAGVYVVARVSDPNGGCKSCALPFKDPFPADLELDLEYELHRWIPKEPIVYIGKTDETIRKRVAAFYRHKCGDGSPHAGGQVVHLLECDLWVYWSPSDNPYDTELSMLCSFKEEADQVPFANFDGKQGKLGRRIRRSS